MCQLFGVSASAPVRLDLTWDSFASKGSATSGNPDGWGVALCEGRDALLIREPRPAASSPTVRFLESNAPAAPTVISHVRRASRGEKTLANTQPFVKRVWGRAHVFAHNGFVPGFEAASLPDWASPLGETDSEVLFGHLLGRLEELWRGGAVPDLAKRRRVVEGLAQDARTHGATNFLYWDGDALFAYGHRKTLPGAGVSSEPGLYLLEVDLAKAEGTAGQGAGLKAGPECAYRSLVATQPLDDQLWTPFGAGELLCFRSGRRLD